MSAYKDSELDESASVNEWPVRRNVSRARSWIGTHWPEVVLVVASAVAVVAFVNVMFDGRP